ncbi:MAG: hypothetical protein ACFHX7_15880 [Pseudomonadota bacterium]
MVKRSLLLIMLFWGHTATALDREHWQPVKVEIRGGPGSYELYRGGKPYVVKGVGSSDYRLDLVRQYGGNSIRTWHVGDGSILDAAHANGLTVALCLNMVRERHGFDYDDEAAVRAQFEKMRRQVLEFRDHPALLAWIIGNELNFDHTNPRVWDAVNDVSKMIHELDPNHPTTTALAGISDSMYQLIRTRAPDLDFLSVQVYGMLAILPRLFNEIDITMPLMVTEFGTVGHWETSQTAWGAPVELTSHEKAANYLKGYREVITPFKGRVIGSYAFLWGQKQERTPTWYGMFTPEGEITEAVDALHYAWKSAWPKNRSPALKQLLLNGKTARDSVRLQAGEVYPAQVWVEDPDQDPVVYQWQIMRESTATQVGGDKEYVPVSLPGLIEPAGNGRARVTAPREPGAYRLFVYARDPNRSAAHANVPFFVDP